LIRLRFQNNSAKYQNLPLSGKHQKVCVNCNYKKCMLEVTRGDLTTLQPQVIGFSDVDAYKDI